MFAGDTASEIPVAIVTGLIGLVVGFVPAWYVAKQQRRAERRAHVTELATEFAERLGGATDATRYIVESLDRGQRDERGIDNAQWLVGEASATLTRVRLRVGREAGVAAKTAIEELRRTIELARSEQLTDRTRAAYQRATEAEDTFVRAIRAELGEPEKL